MKEIKWSIYLECGLNRKVYRINNNTRYILIRYIRINHHIASSLSYPLILNETARQAICVYTICCPRFAEYLRNKKRKKKRKRKDKHWKKKQLKCNELYNKKSTRLTLIFFLSKILNWQEIVKPMKRKKNIYICTYK